MKKCLVFLILVAFNFILIGQNPIKKENYTIRETTIKPIGINRYKNTSRIIFHKNNDKLDSLNYDKIEEFSHGLAAFRKDSKWGFIDTNYFVFIFPNFEDISGFKILESAIIPIKGFSDYGLCYVKRDNKWAIIKKNGILITEYKYDYIGPFRDGFGQFINGGKSPNSWMATRPIGGEIGFIDLKGNEYFIGNKFDVVRDVSEGLVMVTKNQKNGLTKVGFIDVYSNIIIPLEYDYSWDFHGGRAVCCKGDFFKGSGKWGFMDNKGALKSIRTYNYVDDFKNGISIVNIGGHGTLLENIQGGTWGVVDTNDILVIDCNYEKIKYIDKNLFGLKFKGKWGVSDLRGNMLIPHKFDDIRWFFDDKCAIKIDNKWGVINKSGEILIPIIYDDVKTFNNGLMPVKLNNRWGIIDTTNNIVVDFEYDDISGFFSPNYSNAKKNGKPCFLELIE